ncbi:hypothetical protein E2I00_006588, partial [Balaenoptera physalus]
VSDALQQLQGLLTADEHVTNSAFHTNFNHVLCDQALHVPLVVSAFYTCVNTLQRKNDIILDLKSNSRIHLSGP